MARVAIKYAPDAELDTICEPTRVGHRCATHDLMPLGVDGFCSVGRVHGISNPMTALRRASQDLMEAYHFVQDQRDPGKVNAIAYAQRAKVKIDRAIELMQNS